MCSNIARGPRRVSSVMSVLRAGKVPVLAGTATYPYYLAVFNGISWIGRAFGEYWFLIWFKPNIYEIRSLADRRQVLNPKLLNAATTTTSIDSRAYPGWRKDQSSGRSRLIAADDATLPISLPLGALTRNRRERRRRRKIRSRILWNFEENHFWKQDGGKKKIKNTTNKPNTVMIAQLLSPSRLVSIAWLTDTVVAVGRGRPIFDSRTTPNDDDY